MIELEIQSFGEMKCQKFKVNFVNQIEEYGKDL